ncbi:hypothetical protein JHK82_024453 [Glycine max]|nr:hypothetical protein JHK85_025046 [Glycine max]KAG5012287.1 hypothetical protein JHK86_024548 [Glycine max]KAG5133265.1 hypothetical protein JHK82_024453 [Glycine max]
MVRPKLILKPIPNGRDRDLAFTKRKKALMTKMTEFSNVCGVKACMIMYDGNYGDAPPLTWPQDDPIEVHSIIKRIWLTMIFPKSKKETLKIKYPTWHSSFNNLGVEELRNFIDRLDFKLEACKQQIEMSKHEHQNEANFSFMQSMVQSESAAPIPGQLNFMQETSQNQFSLVPMRPPNDGNQLDEIEDLTIQLDEIVNWGSQPDEHNQESSLCNYNGLVQSMQPYNYDTALQNIASRSENVQQIVTLSPLLLPKDEFQTDHYSKTLQNQYSNHII